MKFELGDIVYFDKNSWHNRPQNQDKQVKLEDYRLWLNLCRDLNNRGNKKDDYWIVVKILTTVSNNKMIKLINTSGMCNNSTNSNHDNLFKPVVYLPLNDETLSSNFLKKL